MSCLRHETIIFVRQHDRVEIVSELRMYQAIPRPGPRLAHPDIPDIDGYGLFIQLGCVRPPGRFELALQAIDKTLRYREDTVRLLIAAEGVHAWPLGRFLPHCGFHAPDTLHRALQRGDATVLAPGSNDPRCDITLHALASGVPLEAINLAPLPKEMSTPSILEGNAFLAVQHWTSQQSHRPWTRDLMSAIPRRFASREAESTPVKPARGRRGWPAWHLH